MDLPEAHGLVQEIIDERSEARTLSDEDCEAVDVVNAALDGLEKGTARFYVRKRDPNDPHAGERNYGPYDRDTAHRVKYALGCLDSGAEVRMLTWLDPDEAETS